MTLTVEERRELRDIEARARELKARKNAGPRKLAHKRVQPQGEGQRQPRERDQSFMAAIHAEALPCFACLCRAEPMPPAGMQNPIEAAHQKLAIASKGWAGSGKGRSSDRTCVPLCRWHHQASPNACDRAQRKFWDAIGLGDDIADLCRDLYAAFTASEPMAPVLRHYAFTRTRPSPESL